MNAQHTPGPWRVYRIGERVAVETCENPALIVAAATLTGDPKEQEANARLIAASPTMYAALLEVKRLRDLWRSQEDDSIDSVAYMDGLDRLDVDRIVALARGS